MKAHRHKSIKKVDAVMRIILNGEHAMNCNLTVA